MARKEEHGTLLAPELLNLSVPGDGVWGNTLRAQIDHRMMLRSDCLREPLW